MRRGSSYSTHHSLTPPAHSIADFNTSATDLASVETPPAAEREKDKDSGDAVSFTVELTRVLNLTGLYSVDLKRQKGPLMSYAAIYNRLFE